MMFIVKTIAAVLLSGTVSLPCFSVTKADMDPHIRLTSRFLKVVEFDLPIKEVKVDGVVYGSKKYGYFLTKRFKQRQARIKMQFVPPGYQGDIEFHVRYKDKATVRHKMAHSQSFKNPLPEAYQSIRTKVEGRFSSNFFMVSGALPKSRIAQLDERPQKPDMPMKNASRFTFLMIVNRFGEIVWVYVPVVAGEHFNTYVYGRPLRKGRYGIVLGKKDGYFAVVDFRGVKVKELDLKRGPEKFPVHHDFDFGPDRRKVYTISNELYIDRKEKKSYLANNVIQLDLAKGKPKLVARLIDFFEPSSSLHWVENKEKDRFVTWGEKPADHDFHHTNSIRYYPGQGFLMSFKHLDKIAMMSEDFKSVLWTVGRTPMDTYRVKGKDRFSHQHAPSLLENGDLLLFDNGFEVKRSRVLQLRLNRATREVKSVWEYQPEGGYFSTNRSSVTEIESGNKLAFFVDPEIDGKKKLKHSRVDVLLEIDGNSKKKVASMELYYFTSSPGYRAEPLDSIGPEEFLANGF